MARGRHLVSDKKTAATIALRVSTLALLNELAAKRNVSRSELIEQALRETLLQNKCEEVTDEISGAR